MSWGAEPTRRLAGPGLAVLLGLLLSACGARRVAPVDAGAAPPARISLAAPEARAALDRWAEDPAARAEVRARAQVARLALAGDGALAGDALDDAVEALGDPHPWVRRAVAAGLASRVAERPVRDALLRAGTAEDLAPTTRCLVLRPVVTAEPALATLIGPWWRQARPGAAQACLLVAAEAGDEEAAARLSTLLRAGGLKLDLALVEALATSPLEDVGTDLAVGGDRIDELARPSAAAILLARGEPEGLALGRALVEDTAGGPDAEDGAMELLDWLVALPVAAEWRDELRERAARSPSARVTAWARLSAMADGRVDGRALRQALQAEDPELSRLAAEALAVGLSRAPGEPALERAARKVVRTVVAWEHDDPRTRVAVADLVAASTDRGLRDLVAPWADAEEPAVQVAVARALASLPEG